MSLHRRREAVVSGPEARKHPQQPVRVLFERPRLSRSRLRRSRRLDRSVADRIDSLGFLLDGPRQILDSRARLFARGGLFLCGRRDAPDSIFNYGTDGGRRALSRGRARLCREKRRAPRDERIGAAPFDGRYRIDRRVAFRAVHLYRARAPAFSAARRLCTAKRIWFCSSSESSALSKA